MDCLEYEPDERELLGRFILDCFVDDCCGLPKFLYSLGGKSYDVCDNNEWILVWPQAIPLPASKPSEDAPPLEPFDDRRSDDTEKEKQDTVEVLYDSDSESSGIVEVCDNTRDDYDAYAFAHCPPLPTSIAFIKWKGEDEFLKAEEGTPPNKPTMDNNEQEAETVVDIDLSDGEEEDDVYGLARRPPSPTSIQWNGDEELVPEEDTPITTPAAGQTMALQGAEESPRERTIRFAEKVQVCTYETILSYHPHCDGGMALECGWSHSEVESVDLETLEQRSRHRPVSELYLDFFSRRKRLLETTGLTLQELLLEEIEICGGSRALLRRVPTFP